MAKYGINKVILVGNLGKDPELRTLDQGVSVVNFTLATTENFRTRDGQYEDRTEWHYVVLWRGLADTAAKYLRKGSSVYLEGRLVTRSWDGQDGQKKYRTEIEADKMIMLDGRPNTVEGPPGSYTPPGSQDLPGNVHSSGPIMEGNDDLPF